MLSKLRIKLKSEAHLDVRNSSLFHGAMMEIIDTNYAEVVHNLSINPYTQALVKDKDNLFWELTGLNEQADIEILQKIKEIDCLDIKHKDIKVQLEEKEYKVESYDNFIEKHYFNETNRIKKIRFITPTAFKVEGEYQFYPTVKHIFGSIIRKHDSIQTNTTFFTENLIENIEKEVKIVSYNLRSTYFYMEGIKIPAFLGEVTFKVRGSNQFVNFIDTILEYGTYSGVGIKSSIGMGKIIKI